VHDTCVDKTGKTGNANDPAVDPQTAETKNQTLEIHAFGAMSAKARRLHPGLYHHAEKAELGHAEGCQSAPDQWF
jgi:hypothetical protein